MSGNGSVGNVTIGTVSGKYYVGDTRNNPSIKIGNAQSKKAWQKDFDKIDIAPKNGELSLDEICAYRDKEVDSMLKLYAQNPLLLFSDVASGGYMMKKVQEELDKTKQYRNP